MPLNHCFSLVLQLFINLAHQGGARDPRSTPRRLKGIPTAPPQSPKGLFRDPEGLPQDPLSAPKSFFHWCYSYLTIWHTKKSQGTPRASQDAALGSPRYFLRTPRDSSGTPRDLHKTPSALVDRLLPSRDLRFFHDLEGNGPFKRLGLTRTPQEATTYGVGGCREALTIPCARLVRTGVCSQGKRCLSPLRSAPSWLKIPCARLVRTGVPRQDTLVRPRPGSKFLVGALCAPVFASIGGRRPGRRAVPSVVQM